MRKFMLWRWLYLAVISQVVRATKLGIRQPCLIPKSSFILGPRYGSSAVTKYASKSPLKLHAEPVVFGYKLNFPNVDVSGIYNKARASLQRLKQRVSEMSFVQQLSLIVAFQWLYTIVFQGMHIQFPFQLLPTDSGFGVDIGIDTLISVGFYFAFLHNLKAKETLPTLEPGKAKLIPLVLGGLWASFFASGYVAALAENLALVFSALDVPIGPEMLNSLRVLAGHAFWVATGSLLLDKTVVSLFKPNNGWFKINTRSQWFFTSLAGYFVSCTCYNLADQLWGCIEHLVCKGEPHTDIEHLPEGMEWLSTIVGAVGPCITAPWFEELLYRSFTLKSLALLIPKQLAMATSALLFAAHHLNPASLIQLFTLGLVWAAIEQRVDNLLVTIIIHALWNSRVLFGNIIGI